MLLAALRDDLSLQVQKASFDFHRALVANSGLSDESFSRVQRRCSNDFYDYVGGLEPWRGINAANVQQMQVDRALQEYIQEFGEDPTTPEFKEKEQERIARWLADRDARLTAVNAPTVQYERQHTAAFEKRQRKQREYERRQRRQQGRKP